MLFRLDREIPELVVTIVKHLFNNCKNIFIIINTILMMGLHSSRKVINVKSLIWRRNNEKNKVSESN